MFSNVRIVEGGTTQHSHIVSKEPSVLNTMALKSQNITENLHGTARLTKRQILLD